MPSEIRGRRRQSQAEATAAYASAMALLQGPGGRPASDAMAIQRGVAALSTIVGGLPRSMQPEAHTNLGTGLSMLGRSAEAEAAYAASLALRPSSAYVAFNLGVLCADAGRSAEAEAHYEAAASLDPGMATAYNNLGTLLSNRDAPSEARAAFASALVADPTHAQAYNNIANMYKGEDREEEVRAPRGPRTSCERDALRAIAGGTGVRACGAHFASLP